MPVFGMLGCCCHLFLVSGLCYAWLDLSDFRLRNCLGEFLHKPLLGEKKEEKMKLVSLQGLVEKSSYFLQGLVEKFVQTGPYMLFGALGY